MRAHNTYVKLSLRLLEAPLIQRVHQKYYAINFSKVVLPKFPCCGNNNNPMQNNMSQDCILAQRSALNRC